MRDLYRYKSLTPSSAQYGTKQLKVRQEFSDFSMAAAPLSKCIMRRLQVGGGKSIDKARKYLLAGCSIFAHQSHVGKSPKCLSHYDYSRIQSHSIHMMSIQIDALAEALKSDK